MLEFRGFLDFAVGLIRVSIGWGSFAFDGFWLLEGPL